MSAKKEHYKELSLVVTLAEASRLVYRDRKTLTYAIDVGRLAAVKSGRVWLVSLRSLKEQYGLKSPQKP